uniref:Transmembrane protein n=1 Tax=Medicago truncatula TaxID=3880 RepID=I3S627_MEDTR|nr:unknown [Medicago truncatula]
MKGTFSITQAMANRVEGEISDSFLSTAAKRFSMVSLSPTTKLLYLSVLAVQSTTTLSTLFASLNSLMSLMIWLICSLFVPLITLFARSP